MDGKFLKSIFPDKIENQKAEAYYRPCDLSPGYSDCEIGGFMLGWGAIKQKNFQKCKNSGAQGKYPYNLNLKSS